MSEDVGDEATGGRGDEVPTSGDLDRRGRCRLGSCAYIFARKTQYSPLRIEQVGQSAQATEQDVIGR